MARLAEIFAVDPVMSAVVTMAAEDLPADAAFLPDDLPTEAEVLFFGEPVELPSIDDDIISLDTIMWEAQPTGVILTAWANATSRSHI